MLIEKKKQKAIINNEKKRHPLSTQILLYYHLLGDDFWKGWNSEKKTQTPPWFLNVIKLRKSSIKF